MVGLTKNGESSGTEGFSFQMEEIEIMLVRRGQAPREQQNSIYASIIKTLLNKKISVLDVLKYIEDIFESLRTQLHKFDIDYS